MPARCRTIPKVPTQIAGLDEVLEGGFPRGRTTLVSGGPGSGKTVLGLEFLCHGAEAGEPGARREYRGNDRVDHNGRKQLAWLQGLK